MLLQPEFSRSASVCTRSSRCALLLPGLGAGWRLRLSCGASAQYHRDTAVGSCALDPSARADCWRRAPVAGWAPWAGLPGYWDLRWVVTSVASHRYLWGLFCVVAWLPARVDTWVMGFPGFVHSVVGTPRSGDSRTGGMFYPTALHSGSGR